MLGTTFVSHTQPWKTPQHRQNREKQENHVVSLSHREIAISSPFREPLNDPEASISTESAPACTQCTRNMLGTTFVSHTKPWKTPQHRQNRQNKKITLFPQPVTYRGKLAPKGPYENEKDVTEKPYMRGNAPIYIQCTWYMLGTNADTRMASQEAGHVFFVFL